jgi:superfamily I DNA and RNA helicase
LNDYGFDDGLLNVTTSDEEIQRKIDLIIDPNSRQKIQSAIIAKSVEMKRLSEEMWSRVFKVLGA